MKPIQFGDRFALYNPSERQHMESPAPKLDPAILADVFLRTHRTNPDAVVLTSNKQALLEQLPPKETRGFLQDSQVIEVPGGSGNRAVILTDRDTREFQDRHQIMQQAGLGQSHLQTVLNDPSLLAIPAKTDAELQQAREMSMGMGMGMGRPPRFQ